MDAIRISRRPTYALAGALLLILGYFPFVRGGRVPILGMVDLAIHEAGHVFFMWAPNGIMLAMGNGFQALVPLVFAAAFMLQHRDLAGAAIGFAWCASALQDAHVYIADAPYRILPLLGPEDFHDWWQLLGRNGLLDRADELARVVLVLGYVMYVVALVVFVVGLRWDDVWRSGEAGSLFLPWRRAAALAIRAAAEANAPAAETSRVPSGANSPPGSGGEPAAKSKVRVIW